ncbi:patatin-like phospholipase family protein [Nevskia ramosa]|uniref:patatin-like phospholipase family protein n=1 Tax=Nevskia ramosa TaxID=64002 RepID=UPI003D0E65C8
MTAPTHKQLLILQRMEMSLVRAVLAKPSFLVAREYKQLRYLLSFARLHVFAPGGVDGSTRREDVELAQDLIAPLRERVLLELNKPLSHERDPERRLAGANAVLRALHPSLVSARRQLLRRHEGGFNETELDAEVGRKALVTIMGGGGGAGYVYIGAAARLRAEQTSSDYIVGASIGALIGAFLSRARQLDIEALMAWAKGLQTRHIFARPHIGATHTLPGLMRLHLGGMETAMRHPDGSPLRLKDLEIPYEAVIAGMRTSVYDHMPATMRELLTAQVRNKSLSRLVTERMLLIGTFFNPRVVKPIVLGRDPSTRGLRVIDAVGLSAAIPAVLQYEPRRRDAISDAVLTRLREEHAVALFADGGVAANVPARIAWEGVHSGRIGTRNAFYLALDCFHPQFDPRHLWLWPVTQAIQLQLPSQRPYFDWLMRFEPTLSPLNLLPSASDFDKAFQWGWNQADVMMPFLLKALEPIEWVP